MSTIDYNKELDYAIRQVRYIRDNDCDFLTVDTLLAYGVLTPQIVRDALLVVMGAEWLRGEGSA